MAWAPNNPDDTSELTPDDYEAFVDHYVARAQDDPFAIEKVLDFFLNGVVLSFWPMAVNSWILGQVEMAEATGLPWDHLLTLNPTQRNAMKHAANDGFGYLTRANDEFRDVLRPILMKGIRYQINPQDLAQILAETFTQPLPKLRMPYGQYCEMVCRPESAKLHTLGRIDSLRSQGDPFAVVTPHVGSCLHCYKPAPALRGETWACRR